MNAQLDSKNEYWVKLETLINDTRARLDLEVMAGQEQIDAAQAEIEALEETLTPLPRQAKTLRAAGFASKAREVTEEIESLNIQIARLQVKKAQLEVNRRAEVSKKFSAIIPEVALISREGSLATEEAIRQAYVDLATIRSYGQGIESLAKGTYGQPTAAAHQELQEAQERLNTAVSGIAKPKPVAPPPPEIQRSLVSYIDDNGFHSVLKGA